MRYTNVRVTHRIDIPAVAKTCGYLYTACVDNFTSLDQKLEKVKTFKGLSLLEEDYEKILEGQHLRH